MRSTRTSRRRGVSLAAVAAGLAAVAACSPPSSSSSSTSNSGSGGASAATATSAQDLGGLSALETAANKEGALNVIALPPDWANYGAILDAFKKKYPQIKVTSAQPDASSKDEINAANTLKGQPNAPDVFDLGQAVAASNTAVFAPYKVATWNDIPDNLKDASGTWVNDYGGAMSIGYNAKVVPAPATVADLLKPAYKGKVALNGDPTAAGAAFSGVVMASLGNGGSADDISKGVDFFKQLKAAGNFLPVDPTPATIKAGQTPVVIDWDYLNVAQGKSLAGTNIDWKEVVPQNAVLASYYVQAINKGAPHPAAARLWEEFLYSDQGQNLWLAGGARPVRLEAMTKAGTVDKTALAALPKLTGTPVILTQEQSDKAAAFLKDNWSKSIG
ncbi:MAG TPA: ABC transporter substrate-binding protein [Kineosporiaceae bacterium]|nr:ABC transporter substrate-binding protein [Kineosporiaceae bacterium]